MEEKPHAADSELTEKQGWLHLYFFDVNHRSSKSWWMADEEAFQVAPSQNFIWTRTYSQSHPHYVSLWPWDVTALLSDHNLCNEAIT